LIHDEAVRFLSTAEVEGRLEKEFDSLAITDPVRVTLTDGETTARAIFKDEDKFYTSFEFADGRTYTAVKDSYKHEIAAYELDAMLGLSIVPPCVERKIHSNTGSLCLWVENAMTASERIKQKIQPPNAVDWNNQMLVIRLFSQLIYDLDYNNIRNLLVDGEFNIHKVDSSMAFRKDPKLRKPKSLTRFSRTALEALRELEDDAAHKRLAPWLDDEQIETLLARRDAIIALADRHISELGEEAVLY
jgi:hypothetical protein